MADPLDGPRHGRVVRLGPPKIEIVELDPVIRRGGDVRQPIAIRAAAVRPLQELVLVRPRDPVVVGHVGFQQVSGHCLVEPVEIDAAGDGLQLDQLGLEAAQDIGGLIGGTVVPHDQVMALVTQVAHCVFYEVAVVVTKQHTQQPQTRLVLPAPAPWEQPGRHFGHLRSKVI